MLDDVQTLRDCERFTCLPSQLDEEDWHLMSRLRAIDSGEKKYFAADRKARANRGRK